MINEIQVCQQLRLLLLLLSNLATHVCMGITGAIYKFHMTNIDLYIIVQKFPSDGLPQFIPCASHPLSPVQWHQFLLQYFTNDHLWYTQDD